VKLRVTRIHRDVIEKGKILLIKLKMIEKKTVRTKKYLEHCCSSSQSKVKVCWRETQITA
jgi:hypothetical protein